MKTAIITGITGQDGYYLAKMLLQNDYTVYGFGRKKSITSIEGLNDLCGLAFCFGDLTDFSSIYNALRIVQPDEIYNLASQSHPSESWQISLETGDITGLGAHRLFEAARQLTPHTKIYQASSSEMFGNTTVSPQDEETPFSPANPYAVAKIYAQHMAHIYRQTYGLFISCGILFNHESPRRNIRFITQKVTYGAACAKLGINNSLLRNEEGEPIVSRGKLSLGNLHAKRDWGYAPDYVEAMHLMLQYNKPDDFVIGTGVSRSIEDLCSVAYGYVGLNWKDHVVTDPRFLRPIENKSTIANPNKAYNCLGWKHKTNFDEMIAIMIEAHLDNLSTT